MKFKIIVNQIYRIEREIDVASHEDAIQYAEALQEGELPDDAVKTSDFGVHLLDEQSSE